MDGMTEMYGSQEEADAAEQRKAEAAEKERKAKLVELARKRFTSVQEFESLSRKLAEEDLRFRKGDQWDPSVLAARQLDNRPALVINRIPQFERQITNEQRQSKPGIQVAPADAAANGDTAKVFQGLIRHIEADSHADVAYDTALTSAVRGGFGYFRAITDYESDGSFYQCIKIKRVRDPFSVYLDPSAQEPDGSDANWGFVVDDGISKEEFEEEYPGIPMSEGGWGNRVNANGFSCQVVEYFHREKVPDELVQLQQMTQPTAVDPMSGQPVPAGPPVPVGEVMTEFKSDITEWAKQDPTYAAFLKSCQVVKTRPTQRLRVRWTKIAGDTVIEESEFPSQWIPIVPVLGDELWVDGRRYLEGIVRHVKDPQRMVNFWASAITETIALAPKAPWIGPKGSFDGFEDKWKNAASRNYAYLEYNVKTQAGRELPAPTRNAFEAPIQAMSQALQFAVEDMKGTTGIYDSELGNRSNEQSGKAVLARQQQSQTSNIHYIDNLARALRHMGRILIDAIPRVYNEQRIVRIIGEDQTEKMVGINGVQVDGQERMHDLGTGCYDVTVSMGPSYASKRQEAANTIISFVQAYPQAAPIVGDLLANVMDWPGADKIAERLRKALQMQMPGIVEPDPQDKVDPAKLQAQLQQMGQQHDQLVQALGQERQLRETKALELASHERRELLGVHGRLAEAVARTPLEDSQARSFLVNEMQGFSQRLNTFFEPAPNTNPAPPAPGAPQ